MKKILCIFLAAILLLSCLPMTVLAEEDTETVPIFRLYNPSTGEHLLCSDQEEIYALRRLDWSVDGLAWMSVTEGTPVYRLYNPADGSHLYTTSQKEINSCKRIGWTVDGIVCYSASPSQGKPVYRLYNPTARSHYHLFSTDQKEINQLKSSVWKLEGIAWYASRKEHIHDFRTVVSVTSPTCTKEGYCLGFCPCGASEKFDIRPALGHSWSREVIEKEPTPQEPGISKKTCTRCGISETTSIPYDSGACLHDWKITAEKALHDQGLVVYKNLTYTCSKCGKQKDEYNVPQVQEDRVRGASQELFTLTNNMRRSKGLKVLSNSNPQWQAYADLRAKEQAQRFGHTRPDGSSCEHRIGNSYLCAENVAMVGGHTWVTGSRFYEQYKSSEGHWKNMQIGHADELYVGTYVDPYKQEVYNAMVFVDNLY